MSFFTEIFLVRGRLPLSSFLCFIGGFSMGSWLTIFNQLQAEKADDSSSWDLMRSSSIGGTSAAMILLAVLIPSSPTNGHLRDTIRNTWLQLSSSPAVRHVFLVGTLGLDSQMQSSLEKENRSHQDLLLLPSLKDSYSNLTLKVIYKIKTKLLYFAEFKKSCPMLFGYLR